MSRRRVVASLSLVSLLLCLLACALTCARAVDGAQRGGGDGGGGDGTTCASSIDELNAWLLPHKSHNNNDTVAATTRMQQLRRAHGGVVAGSAVTQTLQPSIAENVGAVNAADGTSACRRRQRRAATQHSNNNNDDNDDDDDACPRAAMVWASGALTFAPLLARSTFELDARVPLKLSLCCRYTFTRAMLHNATLYDTFLDVLLRASPLRVLSAAEKRAAFPRTRARVLDTRRRRAYAAHGRVAYWTLDAEASDGVDGDTRNDNDNDDTMHAYGGHNDINNSSSDGDGGDVLLLYTGNVGAAAMARVRDAAAATTATTTTTPLVADVHLRITRAVLRCKCPHTLRVFPLLQMQLDTTAMTTTATPLRIVGAGAHCATPPHTQMHDDDDDDDDVSPQRPPSRHRRRHDDDRSDDDVTQRVDAAPPLRCVYKTPPQQHEQEQQQQQQQLSSSLLLLPQRAHDSDYAVAFTVAPALLPGIEVTWQVTAMRSCTASTAATSAAAATASDSGSRVSCVDGAADEVVLRHTRLLPARVDSATGALRLSNAVSPYVRVQPHVHYRVEVTLRRRSMADGDDDNTTNDHQRRDVATATTTATTTTTSSTVVLRDVFVLRMPFVRSWPLLRVGPLPHFGVTRRLRLHASTRAQPSLVAALQGQQQQVKQQHYERSNSSNGGHYVGYWYNVQPHDEATPQRRVRIAHNPFAHNDNDSNNNSNNDGDTSMTSTSAAADVALALGHNVFVYALRDVDGVCAATRLERHDVWSLQSVTTSSHNAAVSLCGASLQLTTRSLRDVLTRMHAHAALRGIALRTRRAVASTTRDDDYDNNDNNDDAAGYAVCVVRAPSQLHALPPPTHLTRDVSTCSTTATRQLSNSNDNNDVATALVRMHARNVSAHNATSDVRDVVWAIDLLVHNASLLTRDNVDTRYTTWQHGSSDARAHASAAAAAAASYVTLRSRVRTVVLRHGLLSATAATQPLDGVVATLQLPMHVRRWRIVSLLSHQQQQDNNGNDTAVVHSRACSAHDMSDCAVVHAPPLPLPRLSSSSSHSWTGYWHVQAPLRLLSSSSSGAQDSHNDHNDGDTASRDVVDVDTSAVANVVQRLPHGTLQYILHDQGDVVSLAVDKNDHEEDDDEDVFAAAALSHRQQQRRPRRPRPRHAAIVVQLASRCPDIRLDYVVDVVALPAPPVVPDHEVVYTDADCVTLHAPRKPRKDERVRWYVDGDDDDNNNDDDNASRCVDVLTMVHGMARVRDDTDGADDASVRVCRLPAYRRCVVVWRADNAVAHVRKSFVLLRCLPPPPLHFGAATLPLSSSTRHDAATHRDAVSTRPDNNNNNNNNNNSNNNNISDHDDDFVLLTVAGTTATLRYAFAATPSHVVVVVNDDDDERSTTTAPSLPFAVTFALADDTATSQLSRTQRHYYYYDNDDNNSSTRAHASASDDTWQLSWLMHSDAKAAQEQQQQQRARYDDDGELATTTTTAALPTRAMLRHDASQHTLTLRHLDASALYPLTYDVYTSSTSSTTTHAATATTLDAADVAAFARLRRCQRRRVHAAVLALSPRGVVQVDTRYRLDATAPRTLQPQQQQQQQQQHTVAAVTAATPHSGTTASVLPFCASHYDFARHPALHTRYHYDFVWTCHGDNNNDDDMAERHGGNKREKQQQPVRVMRVERVSATRTILHYMPDEEQQQQQSPQQQQVTTSRPLSAAAAQRHVPTGAWCTLTVRNTQTATSHAETFWLQRVTPVSPASMVVRVLSNNGGTTRARRVATAAAAAADDGGGSAHVHRLTIVGRSAVLFVGYAAHARGDTTVTTSPTSAATRGRSRDDDDNDNRVAAADDDDVWRRGHWRVVDLVPLSNVDAGMRHLSKDVSFVVLSPHEADNNGNNDRAHVAHASPPHPRRPRRRGDGVVVRVTGLHTQGVYTLQYETDDIAHPRVCARLRVTVQLTVLHATALSPATTVVCGDTAMLRARALAAPLRDIVAENDDDNDNDKYSSSATVVETSSPTPLPSSSSSRVRFVARWQLHTWRTSPRADAVWHEHDAQRQSGMYIVQPTSAQTQLRQLPFGEVTLRWAVYRQELDTNNNHNDDDNSNDDDKNNNTGHNNSEDSNTSTTVQRTRARVTREVLLDHAEVRVLVLTEHVAPSRIVTLADAVRVPATASMTTWTVVPCNNNNNNSSSDVAAAASRVQLDVQPTHVTVTQLPVGVVCLRYTLTPSPRAFGDMRAYTCASAATTTTTTPYDDDVMAVQRDDDSGSGGGVVVVERMSAYVTAHTSSLLHECDAYSGAAQMTLCVHMAATSTAATATSSSSPPTAVRLLPAHLLEHTAKTGARARLRQCERQQQQRRQRQRRGDGSSCALPWWLWPSTTWHDVTHVSSPSLQPQEQQQQLQHDVLQHDSAAQSQTTTPMCFRFVPKAAPYLSEHAVTQPLFAVGTRDSDDDGDNNTTPCACADMPLITNRLLVSDVHTRAVTHDSDDNNNADDNSDDSDSDAAQQPFLPILVTATTTPRRLRALSPQTSVTHVSEDDLSGSSDDDSDSDGGHSMRDRAHAHTTRAITLRMRVPVDAMTGYPLHSTPRTQEEEQQQPQRTHVAVQAEATLLSRCLRGRVRARELLRDAQLDAAASHAAAAEWRRYVAAVADAFVRCDVLVPSLLDTATHNNSSSNDDDSDSDASLSYVTLDTAIAQLASQQGKTQQKHAHEQRTGAATVMARDALEHTTYDVDTASLPRDVQVALAQRRITPRQLRIIEAARRHRQDEDEGRNDNNNNNNNNNNNSDNNTSAAADATVTMAADAPLQRLARVLRAHVTATIATTAASTSGDAATTLPLRLRLRLPTHAAFVAPHSLSVRLLLHKDVLCGMSHATAHANANATTPHALVPAGTLVVVDEAAVVRASPLQVKQCAVEGNGGWRSRHGRDDFMRTRHNAHAYNNNDNNDTDDEAHASPLQFTLTVTGTRFRDGDDGDGERVVLQEVCPRREGASSSSSSSDDDDDDTAACRADGDAGVGLTPCLPAMRAGMRVRPSRHAPRTLRLTLGSCPALQLLTSHEYDDATRSHASAARLLRRLRQPRYLRVTLRRALVPDSHALTRHDDEDNDNDDKAVRTQAAVRRGGDVSFVVAVTPTLARLHARAHDTARDADVCTRVYGSDDDTKHAATSLSPYTLWLSPSLPLLCAAEVQRHGLSLGVELMGDRWTTPVGHSSSSNSGSSYDDVDDDDKVAAAVVDTQEVTRADAVSSRGSSTMSLSPPHHRAPRSPHDVALLNSFSVVARRQGVWHDKAGDDSDDSDDASAFMRYVSSVILADARTTATTTAAARERAYVRRCNDTHIVVHLPPQPAAATTSTTTTTTTTRPLLLVDDDDASTNEHRQTKQQQQQIQSSSSPQRALRVTHAAQTRVDEVVYAVPGLATTCRGCLLADTTLLVAGDWSVVWHTALSSSSSSLAVSGQHDEVLPPVTLTRRALTTPLTIALHTYVATTTTTRTATLPRVWELTWLCPLAAARAVQRIMQEQQQQRHATRAYVQMRVMTTHVDAAAATAATAMRTLLASEPLPLHHLYADASVQQSQQQKDGGEANAHASHDSHNGMSTLRSRVRLVARDDAAATAATRWLSQQQQRAASRTTPAIVVWLLVCTPPPSSSSLPTSCVVVSETDAHIAVVADGATADVPTTQTQQRQQTAHATATSSQATRSRRRGVTLRAVLHHALHAWLVFVLVPYTRVVSWLTRRHDGVSCDVNGVAVRSAAVASSRARTTAAADDAQDRRLARVAVSVLSFVLLYVSYALAPSLYGVLWLALWSAYVCVGPRRGGGVLLVASLLYWHALM